MEIKYHKHAERFGTVDFEMAGLPTMALLHMAACVIESPTTDRMEALLKTMHPREAQNFLADAHGGLSAAILFLEALLAHSDERIRVNARILIELGKTKRRAFESQLTEVCECPACTKDIH